MHTLPLYKLTKIHAIFCLNGKFQDSHLVEMSYNKLRWNSVTLAQPSIY